MMESQQNKKSRAQRSWLVICGLLLLVLIIAACDTQAPAKGGPQKPAGVTSPVKPGEQATATTASLTADAGECGKCHAMAPEVTTWQLSSHNKFECTTCHQSQASDYSNMNPAGPIKIKKGIAADTCKQCHSPNRNYSPSGDLKIPHEKHDNAGIACAKCHSGVAHANIAERQTTAQEGFSDLAKWTVTTAEKVVTKYYTQPSMWTCISCHKSLGITRACAACHTRNTSLPSHESGNWLVAHGKNGRKGIGDCSKCHSIPGEEKFVVPSTGDKAADFARANKFCYSCHTTRPEFHSTNMLSEHPSLAIDRGVVNCWTCHNKTKPRADENVAATYCNQCHWFSSEIAPPEPSPEATSHT